MSETDDHRTRRLTQLADAIEGNIPEDWIFFCVIGDPNDPNTNNVVSNATVENAVKALRLITAEITKRYEKLGPDAVHPI